MKSMNLISALSSVARYPKLDPSRQKALQQQRLQSLIAYARAKSPYFQKHYQHLSPTPQLTALPPTNKVTLMAHFDEWLTDRSITLKAINQYLENPDNIGRWFQNQYLVFTTSGSTGNPAIVLYDKTANNIASAINLLRSIARPEDFKRLLFKGFKTAGVYATGGFYLGYGSVRNRLLSHPRKGKKMMVTSILNPISQICEELNQFQPAMLGGYPTALELLMEEQKQGRLKISPRLLMTGGEYLSPSLRKSLSQVFSCYVQTSYSCTEGGTIACECPHQHLHMNEDWMIVEPVDHNDRPVPDGTQSDKVLLTNLSNFTQPFIRYEITDRVIYHKEPCPCGNPAPWLEIEGRTDDILTFQGDHHPVQILPLALYSLLKEQQGILLFQVVAHPGNRLELRFLCGEGAKKERVFELASQRLRAYFHENGVSQVSFELSPLAPQRHPKSGKFKHVYMAD